MIATRPTKYTPAAASALVLRWIEAGDTVLEIGAADGTHSALYAARVGPTGCVLAVEPHPEQLLPLRELQRTYPQLQVLSAAVGSHTGAAILRCGGKLTTSSLYVRNVGTVVDMYPVPMTTIDALVVTLPTTHRLIHLDAQGSEGVILRGAKRTLALEIVWVVELWRDGLVAGGSSIEELLATFRTHGFTPETVGGDRWDWDALQAAVNARGGSNHFDVVMVPA